MLTGEAFAAAADGLARADLAGVRYPKGSRRSCGRSSPSVATLGWILFWEEIDRPELPSWVAEQ
jgi:hypothetical protein